MRFLEYEMHNSNECKRNFVAIYDGSSSVEHLKNKFCSTVANDVMLVSSVGVVRLWADEGSRKSKFRILFTTFHERECFFLSSNLLFLCYCKLRRTLFLPTVFIFSSVWRRHLLLSQQHVHQSHPGLQRYSELCLSMGWESLQRYTAWNTAPTSWMPQLLHIDMIYFIYLFYLEKRKPSILDSLDNTNLTIIGVTCGLVVILLIISVIIQIKQPRKKYIIRRWEL